MAGPLCGFSEGQGGGYCGFAVEIGEKPDYNSYKEFREVVGLRAKIDASKVAEGIAGYTSGGGKTVKLEFGDTLEDTNVWRNGKLHDWKDHRVGYRQVDSKDGLIEQDWMGGTLTVRAGGKEFSCTVGDDGKVEYHNR